MDAPNLAPPNPAIAAAVQSNQQPAPTPPNLPAGSMGDQTPPAFSAPQAPDVTKAHVSVAQRLLGGLFGNSAPTYTIDPKTGVQTATSQPQKPGAFFRNILAASILGGTSAAGTNPEGGFWGGVGTGGRAVQANAKQQDLLRQQQAQKQFENQQSADKANQEKIYSQAQVALMHSQMVRNDNESDLQDKEYHDRKNAASMAYTKYLEDAGGQGAKIKLPDGTVTSSMTASELGQAYMKDPSIRVAPSGFVRHFVDTTDATDVTYNGVQWVNPDGTPVNMSDKTNIQAIDIPENAIKKAVPTLGSVYNKVAGVDELDPSKVYQISPEQMTAARTNNLDSQIKQSQIDLDKKRVAVEASRVALDTRTLNNQITQQNKAEMSGVASFYKERIDNLQKQIDDPNSTLDENAKKAARASIDTATEEYKKAMLAIYPNLTPKDFDPAGNTKPGTVLLPEVVSVLKSIPGYDPRVADQMGTLTPDQLQEQLKNAPSLSFELKNKIRAAAGLPLETAQPAPTAGQLGSQIGNAVVKKAASAGNALGDAAQSLATGPIT